MCEKESARLTSCVVARSRVAPSERAAGRRTLRESRELPFRRRATASSPGGYSLIKRARQNPKQPLTTRPRCPHPSADSRALLRLPGRPARARLQRQTIITYKLLLVGATRVHTHFDSLLLSSLIVAGDLFCNALHFQCHAPASPDNNFHRSNRPEVCECLLRILLFLLPSFLTRDFQEVKLTRSVTAARRPFIYQTFFLHILTVMLCVRQFLDNQLFTLFSHVLALQNRLAKTQVHNFLRDLTSSTYILFITIFIESVPSFHAFFACMQFSRKTTFCNQSWFSEILLLYDAWCVRVYV